MAKAKEKFHTYAKEFTIQVGPLKTVCKAIGIRKPGNKNPTMNFCTPDGAPVKQVYIDDVGNLWQKGQLSTKKADDVTAEEDKAVLTQQEIKAAKASSLPKNQLVVNVHNASDVVDNIYDSDNNAYVLYPHEDDVENLEIYRLLVDVLSKMDAEKVLIGYCNFQSNEGLFRLFVWRNRICMIKQLFPEDINDHVPEDCSGNNQIAVDKVMHLLYNMTEEFDPAQYRNNTKIKLDQLIYGEVAEYKPVFEDLDKEFNILDKLESLGL